MRRLRVISVVPAATEIVTALGAADSLVGVSHECVLAAGLAPRPRFTASALGMSEAPDEINAQVVAMARAGTPLFTLLSTEIAALQPDVIITQPGSSAPSSSIIRRTRRASSRSVCPASSSPAKRRA